MKQQQLHQLLVICSSVSSFFRPNEPLYHSPLPLPFAGGNLKEQHLPLSSENTFHFKYNTQCGHKETANKTATHSFGDTMDGGPKSISFEESSVVFRHVAEQSHPQIHSMVVKFVLPMKY